MAESLEIFAEGPEEGPDDVAAAVFTPSTGTPVSVQIILQIGTEKKDLDALAATGADPYKIARGLLNGLRDDAISWLNYRES